MRLKKKRSTVADAIKFCRDGTYVVLESDYINPEERSKFVKEFHGNLEKLLREQLPKSRRLDLVILKCHLVVEYALDQFIEFHSRSPVDMSKERFSFGQKISLAHMLGLGPDPTLIPSIELLNQLRNQVAHSLKIDKTLLDKLLRINSEDYDQFEEPSDSERVRRIKAIASFICGTLVGQAKATADLDSEAKLGRANNSLD